jgi:hypothetical protein
MGKNSMLNGEKMKIYFIDKDNDRKSNLRPTLNNTFSCTDTINEADIICGHESDVRAFYADRAVRIVDDTKLKILYSGSSSKISLDNDEINSKKVIVIPRPVENTSGKILEYEWKKIKSLILDNFFVIHELNMSDHLVAIFILCQASILCQYFHLLKTQGKILEGSQNLLIKQSIEKMNVIPEIIDLNRDYLQICLKSQSATWWLTSLHINENSDFFSLLKIELIAFKIPKNRENINNLVEQIKKSLYGVTEDEVLDIDLILKTYLSISQEIDSL